MSVVDRFGILFGSLGVLVIASISMGVIGVLVNHNSGLLLRQLVQDIQKDFNVTVPQSILINTTAELQQALGERGMNCSETNSDYVMTKQVLDSLSIEALNTTLTDTLNGCASRVQALEQLISIVGLELTPNLPMEIQSGTVTASLDGSSSVSTMYAVNRITFGNNDQLSMTYVVIDAWPSGIPTLLSASSTLRFNDFAPDLMSIGSCGGVRPILVNRLTGIRFTGYELDCTVAGGEIRLYGEAVTSPGGTLRLDQELSLFGQFL